MTHYAMNINDGRFVFNGPAAQKNPNYADVDDATHAAVKSGRIGWQTIANAVKAKRNNDPNFDWAEYDRMRDALNIRKADFKLKERGDDGKIADAQDENAPQSINPAVSFVEINKTETRHASTEDNTNVGGVEGGDNFIPAPEAARRAGRK